jgi:hypothetical protein
MVLRRPLGLCGSVNNGTDDVEVVLVEVVWDAVGVCSEPGCFVVGNISGIVVKAVALVLVVEKIFGIVTKVEETTVLE